MNEFEYSMVKNNGIKRILCLCKGNICRSPMMEAMLKNASNRAGRMGIAIECAGIKEEAREGYRPVKARPAETPGNNFRKSLRPSFDIVKP